MKDCMMIRGIAKKKVSRSGYSIGYMFALACFHGKCRKKVIMDFFYESTDAESNGVCCDCCDVIFSNMVDG